MEKFVVTGMSCAACSARVEKAVLAVEGVSSCAVSLLTNTMAVEGKATNDQVVQAVVAAGYGASPMSAAGKSAGEAAAPSMTESMLEDRESPILKKRLVWSIVLLLPLMYLASGTTMLGWPLPSFLSGNAMGFVLCQMLLALSILIINKKFFVNGLHGLLIRSPNMDTLVGLGSGASFIWSLAVFFAMTRSLADGDMVQVQEYMGQLYFESSAMILALITVGKLLEAKSKGKTTDALRSLMRLAPQTAVLVKDGQEVEVPAEEVRAGDVFVVRPGEHIPVDGVILEGTSAVNEAELTGESIPVDKAAGDSVHAATINQSGFLRCQATHVGQDTTLAKIIQLVADAAATKAPIAKTADRISGVFVPVVMTIALLTAVVWLLLGAEFSYALARGISILVISCPCALGLATPVAIMVAGGLGARQGILFKTAASLEETGRAKIVVLDKTGTITCGQPEVTDIIAAGGDEKALLELAAALESRSGHPLALAVVKKAEEEGAAVPDGVQDFKAEPGLGLLGVLDGRPLFGGNKKFVSARASIPEEFEKKACALADQGKTPLFFGQGTSFLGLIAVADVLKEDSREAVNELKNMGLSVVMLSGDTERTARAAAQEAGIEEVVAGVLPDEKERVVSALKKQGAVIMVGDGINDAPALASADTGMALGAGTDIAMDAADVVLMHSSLKDVACAIRLSRATLTTIHQNLFWAFIYNIIGIPLAAGALTSFGLTLSPMFGAAAMSLSSFCVVSNALRLNFRNIRDAGHDGRHAAGPRVLGRSFQEAMGWQPAEQPADASACTAQADARPCEPAMKDQITNEQSLKEGKTMKKTVAIEGMMCGHCEAHMKEALEKLDGVVSAVCDHNACQAVVETSKDVSEEDIKNAVAAAGYTYKGLK